MKSSIAISLAGTFAMIAPAHAQTIPSGHFRDTQNNVYLMGQSPSAEVTLTYTEVAKSRIINADNCGRVIWRATVTNPVPASYSFAPDAPTYSTTSGVPTAEITRCNPDGQAAENGTSGVYRTAAGDFVLGSRPPNAPFELFYKTTKVRKIKANACGVARWGNTATTPHTTETSIRVQGEPISLTGLDLLKPPVCRQGQLYIPAEWLGGSGGGGGS
jgi:hypothetical protein